MMPVSSVEDRHKYGHAVYKSDYYMTSGTSLFIESDVKQAISIHERSNKPVLCTATGELLT